MACDKKEVTWHQTMTFCLNYGMQRTRLATIQHSGTYTTELVRLSQSASAVCWQNDVTAAVESCEDDANHSLL